MSLENHPSLKKNKELNPNNFLKNKVIKDKPILEFWKKNVKKFPALSILAKQI